MGATRSYWNRLRRDLRSDHFRTWLRDLVQRIARPESRRCRHRSTQRAGPRRHRRDPLTWRTDYSVLPARVHRGLGRNRAGCAGKESRSLTITAHARRVPRCPWATTEPAVAYHDEEWGVPVHDDRKLFEFLILEGAQAGLSWITILKKRKNYRKAFD